jgi:stearoyl-CoA desaturase (delta-9 desaturase)
MSEPYLPSRGISRGYIGTFAAFVGVHLACIGAYFTGATAADLWLMFALYTVRMFGVTAGYHRYFAHRAFKTSRVFQFCLAFLAQSSLQSGAVWWAAKHRDHHSHSDQELDVHSPRQYGFWFAHLGWIFNEKAQTPDYSKVPDLTRYPELMWLDRQHFLPGIVLGLVTWSLFGWSGLFVGYFCSTALLYHCTFFINSLAHVLGRQRYLTGDDSRNNWWLAILTLGEGWHNNHHYFMASTRQGFRWWEVDLTYYGLRVLKTFGLVWEMREPPAHVLAGQRSLSAELKERVAVHLANAFPAEHIVRRMQLRWQRANPGATWEEWRRRFGEQVDDARESLSHLAYPDMPSVDDLRRKAARMFARSPAMDEIIERARQKILDSVSAHLAPAPA